jgi:hypothetical protein
MRRRGRWNQLVPPSRLEAEHWYLTLVKRDCSCNKCAPHLRRGSEIVPPHAAVAALPAMRRARDQAAPSVKWDQKAHVVPPVPVWRHGLAC